MEFLAGKRRDAKQSHHDQHQGNVQHQRGIVSQQHFANGDIKRGKGHGDAGDQYQIKNISANNIADSKMGMSLLERGNGGNELRQTGAQCDKRQRNDGFGNTKPLCDFGAVLNQQVCTPCNKCSADDKQEKFLPELPRFDVFLFLGLHTVRIFHALPNGEKQIYGTENQHDNADRSGKASQNVGGKAVDRGASEEEDHRHFQGLHAHRTGIERNGNGGNEGGIADDRANGVAIGHSSLPGQSAGGGNHDLRQGRADGDYRGAHNDVRQVEPAGNSCSTVYKPVAALNEQQKAQCEEKYGYKHDRHSFCRKNPGRFRWQFRAFLQSGEKVN